MSSSQPRVLIVGRTGQVGRELALHFAATHAVVAVGRGELDLSSPEQIRAVVAEAKPDVIVNAAAYTAVDRAEAEPRVAEAVNARAPGVLAEAARKTSALLVHYSTDYVFNGAKSGSWVEDDPTGPLNVYGRTKLAGEEAIRAVGGRYLIFRTSWVYGPAGRNFLLTMLRLGRERAELGVGDDQFGAPTTASELARATQAVVAEVLAGRSGTKDAWAGVYHMTCGGETTWCGFARAIFARAGALQEGRTPQVKAIASADYPTLARRPRHSVLANGKLEKQFGVRLLPWAEALDAVLAELGAKAAAQA